MSFDDDSVPVVRIISSLGQELSAAQVAHWICISTKIDIPYGRYALKLSLSVLFSFARYMSPEYKSLIACGTTEGGIFQRRNLGFWNPKSWDKGMIVNILSAIVLMLSYFSLSVSK